MRHNAKKVVIQNPRWPTIDDIQWRLVYYPTWQNHKCETCGATILHNIKIYYADGAGNFRHKECHAKATGKLS